MLTYFVLGKLKAINAKKEHLFKNCLILLVYNTHKLTKCRGVRMRGDSVAKRPIAAWRAIQYEEIISYLHESVTCDMQHGEWELHNCLLCHGVPLLRQRDGAWKEKFVGYVLIELTKYSSADGRLDASDLCEYIIEKRWITAGQILRLRSRSGGSIFNSIGVYGNLRLLRYLASAVKSQVPNTLYEKNIDGYTIFTNAAGRGGLELLQEAFEVGAMPEVESSQAEAIASEAIVNGQVAVLEYLVTQRHYDLKKLFEAPDGYFWSKTPTKHSPLVKAALAGHFEVVEYFIANLQLDATAVREKIPGDLLLAAVKGGNIALVEYLLPFYGGVQALETHCYDGKYEDFNAGGFFKGENSILACHSLEMFNWVLEQLRWDVGAVEVREKLLKVTDADRDGLMYRMARSYELLCFFLDNNLITATDVVLYGSRYRVTGDHPLVMLIKNADLTRLERVAKDVKMDEMHWLLAGSDFLKIACKVEPINYDVVEFLIKKGFDPHQDLIMHQFFIALFKAGKKDVAEYFLERKYITPEQCKALPWHEEKVFMELLKAGRRDAAKYLLDKEYVTLEECKSLPWYG